MWRLEVGPDGGGIGCRCEVWSLGIYKSVSFKAAEALVCKPVKHNAPSQNPREMDFGLNRKINEPMEVRLKWHIVPWPRSLGELPYPPPP